MSTPYITTPPLDATLLDLVTAILGRGVAPRCGDVPEQQCEYCGEVDAVTTVRVYGQPRDEVLLPVEQPEVCSTCAPAVIRRAVDEARDDASDIVVEVAA